jgi:hypothetical protein
MLKYLRGGLGGPPIFFGLPVYQRRGDPSCGQWRLFCFSPVIACLFFVAGVVYVGDEVSPSMQPQD